MATLNEIARRVIDSLDRPFDPMLLNRVKGYIIDEYNTVAKRAIERNGMSALHRQKYYIELTSAYYPDTNVFTVGSGDRFSCYKSKNRIPTPMRYDNDTPFLYVGSPDYKYPYLYKTPEALMFNDVLGTNYQLTAGASKIICYWFDIYFNLYVVGIPASEEARFILIEAPYANPRLAFNQEDVDAGIRYADDMEFPLTPDLVNSVILAITKNHLTITDHKDKVEATHLDNN